MMIYYLSIGACLPKVVKAKLSVNSVSTPYYRPYTKRHFNMEVVQGLISRIRAACDSRAVDLEQELISYDRKLTGVISPISLHRWISTLGLHFSTQQVQTIANAFKKGEGVDWRGLQFNIENSKARSDSAGGSKPPTQCINELRKLAGMLAVRQQTLRELLKPYDSSNRGRVTPDQFYRAFGSSEITKQLVKYYADTVTGFINYFRMQNDIEGLGERVVDKDTPVTELPDCFEHLARYIKSRSIDLFKIFRRVDSSNTGKLNENTFMTAIASIQAPISPMDIRDIAQVFYDENARVCNYKQFILTVDAFQPRPSEKVVSATLKSEAMKPVINTDEIINVIKNIIRKRRINISDYFATLPSEGYDKGVPARLFAQIITSVQLSLHPDEIRAVAEMFQLQDEPGMVDYNAFVHKVSPPVKESTINTSDVISRLKEYIAGNYTTFRSSAERYDREGSGDISSNQLISALQFIGFEASNQEIIAIRNSYPGKERGAIAWMELSADIDPKTDSMRTSRRINEDSIERKAPQMRAKPSKAVNSILLVIQKSVNIYSIDLESYFLRCDRKQKGYVTTQEFGDIILSLKVNLNQSDIRVLTQFFRISGSADVDYGYFIDEVNSAAPIVEEVEEEAPVKEQQTPELSPSVRNFIRRFKSFAIMRRITAYDIFSPYDNQKNGTVQVFKVAAAFNNVQFPAMRAELEDLCSTFRDSRKKELFNYNLFERAVKEEDIDNDEARAELTGAPISAEINRDALITCLQIREKLRSRRRRIDMFFSNVQTDTIPSAEFQRRLQETDVVLRAGQITALIRKYRVGLTDAIKWRDFCSDVEKSKTIGDGF
jgi:Ca2+-binding EF-hand superfamily protein